MWASYQTGGAMTERIRIREVGPREGFQNLPAVYPTEQKLELISLLTQAGLKEIEVAAFVRADRVPQMADAAEVIRALPKGTEVAYSALYLNQKGFKNALSAEVPFIEGWIPVAMSESFLKRNNNLTLGDLYASLPGWEECFREASVPLQGLMVSAAFGANDEGAIPLERLLSVLEATFSHLSIAPREVCLADTMGWGTPRKVAQAVRAVRETFGCEVSLHLHDTRGTGIANVYAGIEEGVRIFDSSFGGVGGCPFVKGAAGNVATEEVVFLCHEMGLDTGVDLDKLMAAVLLLEKVVGPVPSRYFRSALRSSQ